MRRIIALLGLVTVEKIDVAVRLAQHMPGCTVIDNIARMGINPDLLPETVRYMRVTVDLSAQLATIVEHTEGDLLIAFSENEHPEASIAALDELSNITVIALIDERTCDCFPELGQMLKDYADITLYPPFNLDGLDI